MQKIKVLGDPNNQLSCSSEIIISNLNKGLKSLDLYDENGPIVVYDCLAQTYGYNTDHIICAYETSAPYAVLNNAGGRNLIGVSVQNQSFFINGGYPKEKTWFTSLGVDTTIWKPSERIPNKTFVFGMCCDSNTRAAYFELLIAFGEIFRGNKNVSLYFKDRWATSTFKQMVQLLALKYEITVVHDDNHVTDKQVESNIYNSLDCHVFLNKTSTFALTVAQGMAMQKPTIVMAYSGPRDYCNELNACLVDYDLVNIPTNKITDLTDLGLRNYLLMESTQFRQPPQWAVPRKDSIQAALKKVFEDEKYRNSIAHNARATAESMTWERAALNLAYIVHATKTI